MREATSSTLKYNGYNLLMHNSNTSITATGVHRIEGYPLPVEIRRHARARRITLKLHSIKGRIVLTLPMRASVKSSLAFMDSKKGWLLAQIGDEPAPRVLQDGDTISVLGETLRITHAPGRRGSAWIEDEKIMVTGSPEFLARRVRDFLKAHAKKRLGEMARHKAERIGKSITRIDVRDMHSRWGSCASNGRLCFSWRLVLAPKDVCEYVVAHEVAHLVHLDHSAAFWNVVDALHVNKEHAQLWLRKHGKTLFAVT